MNVHVIKVPTSFWEELGVDAFEGVLFDDSCGTLCLEAAVYPLELGLREAGSSAEGGQTVGAVARGRL